MTNNKRRRRPASNFEKRVESFSFVPKCCECSRCHLTWSPEARSQKGQEEKDYRYCPEAMVLFFLSRLANWMTSQMCQKRERIFVPPPDAKGGKRSDYVISLLLIRTFLEATTVSFETKISRYFCGSQKWVWYRYCESFFPFSIFFGGNDWLPLPTYLLQHRRRGVWKRRRSADRKTPHFPHIFCPNLFFFFFSFIFSKKGEEEASLLPIPNLPLLPFPFHFSCKVTTFDSPVSFRDKAGKNK